MVYFVLRLSTGSLVKRVMRYRCKKTKGPFSPSLIISNHCTDLDPPMVGLAFSRQMYFLASEHAFRNGFPSKVMKFLFDPIPISKTRTDIHAIREILRRLKRGANVCLFAEGDRTFTGRTVPISASTAKLAKASGADLITFRIEGGFFTHPRWAKKQRKGEMSGRIVNKYSAEELKTMTEEQVLSLIERDVFEDAYERQKVKFTRFRGNDLAESIETALFLCPGCKKLGSIRSEGNSFSCECGLSGIFTETGMLVGESLPFSTMTDWGDWQLEELSEIVNNAGDGPICSDECQMLFEVRVAVDKKLLGEGRMQIGRDGFSCAGRLFPLECITRFAVAGQMTLLFSLKDGSTYEVRSEVPRSALKYREIFRLLTEGI